MESRHRVGLDHARPMRGYGPCPVAKAAEIVAEAVDPLVLRELLCGSR